LGLFPKDINNMFRDLKIRLIIIALLTSSAIYFLWPTYKQYYSNNTTLSNNEKQNLEANAIKLGLDLQGGMYVLLELDVATLVEKLASQPTDELKEIIKYSRDESILSNRSFFAIFTNKIGESDIRLSKYYSELRESNNSDEYNNKTIINLLKNNRDNALKSAIQILRNRIDEFGVSEPTIQKLGTNRIVVELAGIEDSDRARKLIQRTASLELALVLDDRIINILPSIDNYFIANSPKKMKDEANDIKSSDSNNLDSENPEDILRETNNKDNSDLTELTLNFDNIPKPENLKENPFSAYIVDFVPEGYGVLLPFISEVEELMTQIQTAKELPRGGRLVWGNTLKELNIGDGQFIKYKPIYYITDNPAIKGGMIRNPIARIAPPGSQNAGKWVISLDMNPQGARNWSRFTGSNIGKRVAIVLDNKVYMAPFINDKIPTGQTLISGLDDANEAQDIANVLRAGELPAPINIIEERTVGPSLGNDSIQSGKNALIIAFLSVLIFILLYYKVSGIIANIALLLNVIFVLSLLALLGATLTLPGIAGLILTIGISVDANVIIFERIKEELELGKNISSAVRSGYDRAFVTILDANVTTLIAAFVLANIGSGPIKGFAITLSIGIICSMFTAIFITRTLYMVILKNGKQKLSI
jgi:protein-export membrane protein SecD